MGVPQNRLMENQTTQSILSQKLPTNHEDLLREAETIRRLQPMADRFLYHMDTIHRKIIAISNPKTKQICTRRASHSSRYTEPGLEKIRRKIHERLSPYKETFGTLLTLTVARIHSGQNFYHGKDQLDAWEGINSDGRKFTDGLNKWRKRHGLMKVRGYVKVLEIQKESNYPHLHLYFPGLKWLAPIDIIQKLWPYGNADIAHTDSTSPGNYITKYLSKLEGKEFMNIMLYEFNLRMFSNSRGLKYAPEIRKKKDWGFFAAGTRYQLDTFINKFLHAGYSMVGQRLTEPRGP